MTYQGRALYNLLQMNLKQNPALEVQSWQIENYRAFHEEELFESLEQLEVFINRDHFLLYVEESDSPEDMADILYLGDDFEKHERLFLLVFELWRRLAPHKQSLSIFVDELDHLIERYEEGDLEVEENLESAIESFEQILDDHVDEGGDALEGFHLFSAYSCHDLEIFIYDFIAHQLDVEDYLYASELLDGFRSYMENQRWFDLLQIRLMAITNLEEANAMVQRLLEALKDDPDLQLLFETLHYLIGIGEAKFFQMAFMKALKEIQTEADLKELLLLLAEYLSAHDKAQEEKKVEQLLDLQKEKDLSEKLDSGHPAFQVLKEIILALQA